jgi:hypothetical protein
MVRAATKRARVVRVKVTTMRVAHDEVGDGDIRSTRQDDVYGEFDKSNDMNTINPFINTCSGGKER